MTYFECCDWLLQARHPDWKLMMRIEQLDIPDKSYTELCNDALYVYDANNIFGRAMVSTNPKLEP